MVDFTYEILFIELNKIKSGEDYVTADGTVVLMLA